MIITSHRNSHTLKRYLMPMVLLSVAVALFLCGADAFAGQETGIGGVAKNLQGSFSNLARLISSLAWVGGAGFTVGAILKFKQHKDNPTQIPIGTPIALLLVGASLLFLPTILEVTGASLFKDAKVGGATGYIRTGNQ